MMKIFAFLFSEFFFCFDASAQKIVAADLQAAGLTCSMCSNAIQKSLLTLPFVAQVTPDLKHSLFEITFREGQVVMLESVKKKVEDAGFSIASLKIKVNPDAKDFARAKVLKMDQQYFCISATEKWKSESGSYDLIIMNKYFTTDKKQKQYQKIMEQLKCDIPEKSVSDLYYCLIAE
jgi:copper chaperone CopZ